MYWLRSTVLILLSLPTCLFATESTFDASTGILTIPSVSVGATTYTNVKLLNQGAYSFKLQSAVPVGTVTGARAATYTAVSGVLDIPSVRVGNVVYQVQLQSAGNSTFTLKGAKVANAGVGALLASESVYGTYRRLPITNDWHIGIIGPKAGANPAQMLEWRNQASVSWNLIPELANSQLLTDSTNPYAKTNPTNFTIVRQGNDIVGFRFNNEFYQRDDAPAVLTQKFTGLHGYITARPAQLPPEQYAYGFSFYTSIWPVLDKHLYGFQVGLPGTWVIPDNRDFTQPLLPLGAGTIRENSPERASSYWRDVFQTIEGSPGYWANLHFPGSTPKYRINGTQNGYKSQISSPGWPWGTSEALKRSDMGIAQLSNRLLLPPDGITFQQGVNGEMLGVAWMALPFTPATIESDGTKVGNQSWTLFLNSANFKGPVAFWIPEGWSQLSKQYTVINGRGLDSRPGTISSAGIEIGNAPQFLSAAASGTSYAKIPRMSFPVDENGVTYLWQDLKAYSKKALWDSIGSALANGTPAAGRFDVQGMYSQNLTTSPLRLTLKAENGSSLPINNLDKIFQPAIFTTPDSSAFGLKWTGGETMGMFPEYFKYQDSGVVPVNANEVPEETRLKLVEFQAASDGAPYQSPASTGDAWTAPGPIAGPFTADLTDGTTVTYYWYKFIDQPALQTLPWSQTVKTQLQTLVESMHRNWTIGADYIPPPSRGKLVSMDQDNIVTPPPGYEIGYVPIVTRQQKR